MTERTIVPSHILQEWIEQAVCIGCLRELGVRLILHSTFTKEGQENEN